MIDADYTFGEAYGYEIKGMIGHGGYGAVFLAYSLQYKCNFAIKRISIEKFMENEVQCMIEIKSPYIVPLYMYHIHKENVYLVLEYCPDNLANFITSSGHLPKNKIYELAFGAAQAVQACHEQGISHRDIKPQNFLIDNYGRVKICDFGLSMKTITNSLNIGGTLMFASPEILRRKPVDTFSADIWALGVTFYFICTGKYPWSLNSMQNFYGSIVNGIYEENQIEDKFMRKLIRNCLKVDQTERLPIKNIVETLRSKKQSPPALPKLISKVSTRNSLSTILRDNRKIIRNGITRYNSYS